MQNKPNFRNGPNERKLNFNKGLQKKRLFSTPKNKPNSKPISPKGQNELKIACQKIWPHPNRFISEIPMDNTRQVLDNSLSFLQDSIVVVLPGRRKQTTDAKIWRLKTDEQ